MAGVPDALSDHTKFLVVEVAYPRAALCVAPTVAAMLAFVPATCVEVAASPKIVALTLQLVAEAAGATSPSTTKYFVPVNEYGVVWMKLTVGAAMSSKPPSAAVPPN